MAEEENPFADASITEAEEALPAWLDVPVNEPQTPLREAPVAPSAPVSYAPERTLDPGPEAQGEKKDMNLLLLMRLVNVGAAVLMSTTAFFKIISFPGFNSAIIALYIWSFSILLCCFETHLKFVSRIIAKNFGFLYHVKGRCAFLALLGILCIGLGAFGFIAGFCIIGAAIFNAYVIFKHPEYEQNTMINDIEQRGPETVSESYLDPFGFNTMNPSQTNSSFAKQGLDWAAQNPDSAARMLSSGAQFAAQNPELTRSITSSSSSATYV